MRPAYDCDTSPYWTSETDLRDTARRFGHFVDGGAAYEITDRNTPRPWLNYLCNDRFGSAISNTGLGFTWYGSALLRITKYEHPIDYLPREFQDGREVVLRDAESGEEWNVFRDAEDVRCTHRPGMTTLSACVNGISVDMSVFVPQADPAECWLICLKNGRDRTARLGLRLEQTWTFSKFGIHTAEEGIPYLSTPGEDLEVEVLENAIVAHSTNGELPMELFGLFFSPQASAAAVTDQVETRKDGRVFTFKICSLRSEVELAPGEERRFDVLAGAGEERDFAQSMLSKYTSHQVFGAELGGVRDGWQKRMDQPSCVIPDKDLQSFLNVWLKNQLHLTFRFVRSGYMGYRDTLQDAWGYTLIDPDRARRLLLRTLSHMMKDGSCPRNYAPFRDKPDLRRFMDSGTWIGMTLSDYVKETGETGILEERLRYLDDEKEETVGTHVRKALDLLFESRGRHGLCLTGDGDWNDALEGISGCGDAESAWLTMALFHAQNRMADLYRHVGASATAAELTERSAVLKQALNESAWDGDWFVYGFTGSGKPIGAKSNREGRIHLNAQTWAIFSGLAAAEQTEKMRDAIHEHLDTEFGPALLAPPYVEEGDEVGRIARLEPGTFENGSIYQHAVAFKIWADLHSGHCDEAYRTFVNLLPTNRANPDCRRTSEPYCTGNYYCGPSHPRFGQNFFTWFTGTPAWLLRAGFDRILGVRAEFDGLLLRPKPPSDWRQFSVRRRYRHCVYDIEFKRASGPGERRVVVDGGEPSGNLVPIRNAATCSVICWF